MMSIMQAKLHGFPEYIQQQMEQWKVPGLAIAVIQGQQIAMAEGFGLRNVELGLKVTPETLFAIGSCTKAFTAMSAGMLVDEGKLDWDRPVKEYLPNFKLFDGFATERITIRDMLCHRSGLPRHDLMWYNAPFTREEIIERLQYLEPNHDFRSKWQYNNLMYTAAGYLVGQLAGVPWEQWVQERIFEPLLMANSNFSIEETARHTNAAVPYIDKDNQMQATAYRNLDVIGPAGSINSNVMEMANWVLLQLNQGAFQGQRLVTEGSIATMHTPQMPCDSSYFWKKELPICTYGLGWCIESYRGYQLVHHNGGIDGFSSLISFLPQENIGVVLLTNKNGSLLPRFLSYTLFDRLLELEPLDWSERMATEIKQYEEWAKQGKEAMRKETDRSGNEDRGSVTVRAANEYAGRFEHPAYGELVVEWADGQLRALFHGLAFPMTPLGDDRYELYFDVFDLSIPAVFHADTEGSFSRLTVSFLLDPGAKEIEFVKVQDPVPSG